MRPCMDCGELTDLGPRCDACRPVAFRARKRTRTPRDRGTFRERGCDFRWTYLSRRARRLQPRCSDCGSSEDLTGHHAAEAWRRRDAGLPIRLSDIDVLCRGCSARSRRPRATEQQGPARATRPRAGGWWRRRGRGRRSPRRSARRLCRACRHPLDPVITDAVHPTCACRPRRTVDRPDHRCPGRRPPARRHPSSPSAATRPTSARPTADAVPALVSAGRGCGPSADEQQLMNPTNSRCDRRARRP